MLHITKHTDGSKMDLMQSISTSTLCNPNCKKNAACKGSICEKCYASTTLKMRKGLNEHLQKNTKILTNSILEFDDLPKIHAVDSIFRFEAFGDLINTNQVINYFNICKKNPKITFSIWTKCPHIIREVLRTEKKPDNLIIIVSSLFINKALNIDNYDFADKVFTVYTADYAIENNIKIGCGFNHCIECQKCYDKENKDIYINELLKSDQKKYLRLLNK